MRVSNNVVQASSGFSRGDCVRFNGEDWVLAATGGMGVGVVGSLNSSGTFEFVQMGELDGLDGLTPGATYYTDSNGQLSTTVNGPPIGIAYTDKVLLVGSEPGAGASATAVVDTSQLVTATEMAAAIASAVALQAAVDSQNHLHSINLDGVISVTPGHSGVVFLETDGTQVLTE